MDQLARSPEKLRTISRNDQVAGWTVLHPEANDRFPQADDNALVLSRTLNGIRVLLLSDLGRLGQAALAERTPDLRADIVVTGLPVKPDAVDEALLAAINPKVIIVADSEFPVSERATKALCNRLAQHSVPVIYTRFMGAVTIEFRGQEWELHTMSGMKISSRSLRPKSRQTIRTEGAEQRPAKFAEQ